MAYIVNEDFTEQLYSGESNFRATLIINNQTIPNDQIASISISSPLIDDSQKVFHLGEFVSQKITIKFKNMDNIDVVSGQEVSLSIGQYVDNAWVDVPIGLFLIDNLAENYYEKCEISCLDYSVKFKPNIDYSPCFSNGKATIETILKYICDYFGVLLGEYPTTNDDVEVGTYDSTTSGKQYISYIAELKGCNAKMDRQGRLTLQPLKQSSKVPINALQGKSLTIGEKIDISKIIFFDALRNYTFGDEDGDTLFIRQENPFIVDENTVKNIYKQLVVIDSSDSDDTDFDLRNTDVLGSAVTKIYGSTEQDRLTGKNHVKNGDFADGRNSWNDWGSPTTREVSYAPSLNKNVAHIVSTTTKFQGLTQNTGVQVLPNTKYRVSLKAKGNYVCVGIHWNNSSNNIISQSWNGWNITNNWTTYSVTFTSPNDNTLTRFNLMVGDNSDTAHECWFTDVQIEQGETTTSFERFCGRTASPNPDYAQAVKTISGRSVIATQSRNLVEPIMQSYTRNGITCTNNGDGSFTLNGTATAGADFRIDQSTASASDNLKNYHGTYTMSCEELTEGTQFVLMSYINGQYTVRMRMTGSNEPVTANIDSDSCFMYLYVNNGVTVNNLTVRPQLEYSDTATEFKPYQSAQYEIDFTGKNKFNKKDVVKGYYISANGALIADNTTFYSNFISVVPKTQYKVSGKTTWTVTALYDKNFNFISRPDDQNAITIPANVYYIRTIGKITDLNTIQIEKGSVASDYEAHIQYAELCEIDDYVDYITKNTGKNIFEPTLTCDDTNISMSNCTTTLNDDEYILTATGTDMYFSQVTASGTDYTTNRGVLLPVNSAKKIYVYCTNPLFTKNFITWYDANKTSLGYVALSAQNGNATPPNNAEYFTVRFGYGSATSGTIYKTRVMVSYTPITDFEPYGKDEWYVYNKIGKVIDDGSTWDVSGAGVAAGQKAYHSVKSYGFIDRTNGYMERFNLISSGWDTTNPNGTAYYTSNNMYVKVAESLAPDLATMKTWLSNNNLVTYGVLQIPEITKITYQPLIDQLNAVENMKMYDGRTYITSRGTGTNAPLDIKYYINDNATFYNIKAENYGDFTLDAWDNIEYTVDDESYVTLNNNTLTYEMDIMGKVETKISNKQQTVTTNIVGGDDSVNIKKIKTEIDQVNATATILAEQTKDNTTQLSELQVDVDGIKGMFSLTGGKNNIRNSAFLLLDEVWSFAENGANSYHTDLGKSYDVSLAGKTYSISEIQLQNVITTSSSDNITNLKNDGTQYTLSFSYKQDSDTVTRIELYDTNNVAVKAFDDIVITEEKEFTEYSISFKPSSTNYTLKITTTTTAQTGYFYIYDLMLNSGDNQPWSPAPDEIHSNTMTLSRMGLSVYSTGDGTITSLSSNGMATYETTDGQTIGNLVSKRTNQGDITKSNTTELIGLSPDVVAYANGSNKIRWVQTTLELNGKLHKILYLETGE